MFVHLSDDAHLGYLHLELTQVFVDIFTFLLGKYLRVILLGLMGRVCLILKCFLNLVINEKNISALKDTNFCQTNFEKDRKII